MKRKFYEWLLRLWFTSYEGAKIRDEWKKQGAEAEQERIIELLENTFGSLGIQKVEGGYVFATDLATIIRGVNK